MCARQDLREIRVQKKIGIGGYAEVWKAQWRGKTVAFKLLQEETMEQKRVVDEFRCVPPWQCLLPACQK